MIQYNTKKCYESVEESEKEIRRLGAYFDDLANINRKVKSLELKSKFVCLYKNRAGVYSMTQIKISIKTYPNTNRHIVLFYGVDINENFRGVKYPPEPVSKIHKCRHYGENDIRWETDDDDELIMVIKRVLKVAQAQFMRLKFLHDWSLFLFQENFKGLIFTGIENLRNIDDYYRPENRDNAWVRHQRHQLDILISNNKIDIKTASLRKGTKFSGNIPIAKATIDIVNDYKNEKLQKAMWIAVVPKDLIDEFKEKVLRSNDKLLLGEFCNKLNEIWEDVIIFNLLELFRYKNKIECQKNGKLFYLLKDVYKLGYSRKILDAFARDEKEYEQYRLTENYINDLSKRYSF